jgi:hypothetical protein
MVILTFQTYLGNRRGDFMTGPEIVTYIIAPVLAALGVIGGIIKYVIPRIIDARLEGDKDTREHRQKMDALQTEYLKAESESTHQMMGSLLEKSQDKEARAYEFVTNTVFNTLDKIKTDTNHIPVLVNEIKELSKRVHNLEISQRVFLNWLTGGNPIDQPADDYETWKKSKLDENTQPPIKPNETGGNGE